MTTEHLADSYGAEVVRHLAEVPRQRRLRIPERAVALVSGLDSYGD